MDCFLFIFAECFHTLALEGVPTFGASNRTAAYRFVTLVDVGPCVFMISFSWISLISLWIIDTDFACVKGNVREQGQVILYC